ncbi:hypothetical protein V9T40_010821 [Parthenolecanium corni]|uniref:Uncharacterized protein n=1 Tax=Parthenolecanium corni TaxID=536013 RepID=A0AAN9T4U2_9HEMI
MIPSLPETISGTHVEYFPLSAAFLASAFINSYSSYYRTGATDGSGLLRVSDSNDDEPSSKEHLPKTPALPTSVPLSAALSHYFKGCDLHYAPHIHVPAAKSVQNCPATDAADTKTFGTP